MYDLVSAGADADKRHVAVDEDLRRRGVRDAQHRAVVVPRRVREQFLNPPDPVRQLRRKPTAALSDKNRPPLADALEEIALALPLVDATA